MRPIIKEIHSPDVSDLAKYIPIDKTNFGFLLQVMVGPEGSEGEESFDIVVCTPKWLSQNYTGEDIIIGRHRLIMFEYNYDRLINRIRTYIDSCEADSWSKVAEKIGRLGKWEFEDYQEYKNEEFRKES
jgi:hypothetical protein